MYPGLGGTEHPDVRADRTLYETPTGGAVFSTSSIAWAGSLSHHDYDNNVSQITANILDRFLENGRQRQKV
jgi:N,N-dimethylformamidase